MTDLEPDFIQHGIGPYRLIKMGDEPPSPFCVGSYNMSTRRIQMPMDGHPFYIDDPVLGRVAYDDLGQRIVSEGNTDG